MESRQPIVGSRNTCPSCRTRLRISLQANAETEFSCPECGAALAARSIANEEVEFSPVENTTTVNRSSPLPSSHSWRKIIGNSRIIAAVITASVGMLLTIFLTPSVSEPVRRQPDDQSVNSEDSVINNHRTADLAPAESFSEVPGTFEGTSEVATSDAAPQREAATAQLSEGPIQPDPSPQSGVPEIGSPDDISRPQAPLQAQSDKTVTQQMNFRQRLQISILRFRQSDPVTLREVIRIVEQMCQVRVNVSAASVEQLDSPVALSLSKTTPAAILTEAGRKSGLRVIVDENSVRMVPTEK